MSYFINYNNKKLVCGTAVCTPELYRLIMPPLLNVLAPEDVVAVVVMLCVAGS